MLWISRPCSLKRAEKRVRSTSHHHVNVVANKMPAEAGKEAKKNAPRRKSQRKTMSLEWLGYLRLQLRRKGHPD